MVKILVFLGHRGGAGSVVTMESTTGTNGSGEELPRICWETPPFMVFARGGDALLKAATMSAQLFTFSLTEKTKTGQCWLAI